MAKFDSHFVESKVDYLLKQGGLKGSSGSPPSLESLAKIQRVRSVDVRPMFPAGGIAPVSGGFRLFLQDLQAAEPSCRDLDDDSSPLMLSTRQRFTFAHEIVHTFFYDCREAVPARLRYAPRDLRLETLCQDGARRILLPEEVLARRVSAAEPISAHLVRSLCEEFEVSPEVAIRALASCRKLKNASSALLLVAVDDSREDAQILAACYGDSVPGYKKKPPHRSGFLEWWGKPLSEEPLGGDFLLRGYWSGHDERPLDTVRLRKIPYGVQPESFFFELEIVPTSEG